MQYGISGNHENKMYLCSLLQNVKDIPVGLAERHQRNAKCLTHCTEKIIIINKSWVGQFLHVETHRKGKKEMEKSMMEAELKKQKD